MMKNWFLDVCVSLLIDDWPLPRRLHRWLSKQRCVATRIATWKSIERELCQAKRSQEPVNRRADSSGNPAPSSSRRHPRNWRFWATAASLVLALGVGVAISRSYWRPTVQARSPNSAEALEPVLASISATRQMSLQVSGSLVRLGDGFDRVGRRMRSELSQWNFRLTDEAPEHDRGSTLK
ncbi:MAG: hypothetical protein AAF802_11720 [Planctomycetota bacterium]